MGEVGAQTQRGVGRSIEGRAQLGLEVLRVHTSLSHGVEKPTNHPWTNTTEDLLRASKDEGFVGDAPRPISVALQACVTFLMWCSMHEGAILPRFAVLMRG